jgi:hypothetical protein
MCLAGSLVSNGSTALDGTLAPGYPAVMTHRISFASFLLITSLGCGGLMGGGGIDSPECQEYFEVVKTCSKKAKAKGTPAGKAKAEAWRESAKLSRENFEKNPSAPAIAAACEAMIAPIRDDADCQ